jgi:DNA-directed RNA polymerase beta' subunit
MRPRFEAMSDDDVKVRSFGLVRNPVFPYPETWQEQKGSLFDQSIFGPEVDFRCACGKYSGPESDGVICDVCGVKLGEAAFLRKSRFGHINLGRQIPHPWFEEAMIGVIPVLPIAYRQDGGRMDLDYLYSRVIRAVEPSEETWESVPGPEIPPLWLTVRQLFENESTTTPVSYRERQVRSLSDFAFDDPGTGLEEIGGYLAAMMVRIVV